MKRISYFAIELILFCQPANAQKVANRVRDIDTTPDVPGSLLIPGGIGAGVYHQIRNGKVKPILKYERHGSSGTWDEPIGNMPKPQADRKCEQMRKEYNMPRVRVVRDTTWNVWRCVFSK